MNYIDIIILTVVGFFIAWGIKKGIIKTLAGVIGFILAMIIATAMMGMVAGVLHNLFNMNKGAAYVLSYVLLFIGVMLICHSAANVILKLFTITSTRWLDRVGGGILGFLVGSLIVSSILVILSFFTFTERMDKSLLYPYARNFAPGFYNLIPAAKTFQDITGDILDGQPEDALKKTQAGRDLLKYWEKHKPGK